MKIKILIMPKNLNRNKNIATIISIIFLFLAVFNGWPYGFFTLLRFVVFASSVYIAYIAYKEQKEKWVWIFGFFAVLFNPFVPLYFGRNFWVAIDIAVAIFLIISIFIFKISPRSEIKK